ncbi:MAG: amidohydrolase family protein [Acidimicrobiia bacterium]|nr:amidohydrolase family protein [Acidimicrobiia bacterium]
MADLILRDATVFDGTGGKPFGADLAIEHDRISQVSERGGSGSTAVREIDLAGAAVAPGFIDVHTHDDFAVVLYPDAAFKVEQGVTTVVVGNCGMGAAPWPTASLFSRAFHPASGIPEWDGYAGYLAHLDAHAPSVNVAALVGHGTARGEVMHLDDRAPTDAEMHAMRAVVEEGLDAGAFGLSSGLVYEPGCFAATDELVDLARPVRDRGGIYTSHIRDESAGLLGAITEAIAVGERAGVRVQVSHHKSAGRENWGRVNESLALLDSARARGVDVGTDAYPYTAGSTILGALVQHGAFGAPGDSAVSKAPTS